VKTDACASARAAPGIGGRWRRCEGDSECKMAGGAPRAKGAVRQDWTCKSCASKRGRAAVNWGTALKCQGCRLPTATCFGANVPLPAAARSKSKSKSGAALGGGSGKAQRELADLKKQLKASGPASAGGPLGGAQAMEADVGEGVGAGDAAVPAEVHLCESGLRAIKDQTADWAAAPREELRARLGNAKVHADLLEQRVALQAELVQLQQQAPQATPPRPAGQAMAQDVIGGLGITVGELEAVVLQLLLAHPNEEQPVPVEAQKRMAGALGVRIAELCMSKRARRAEAPAEEQASASQNLASTAGEEAVPGRGSGSAVAPRWQPEGELVEQLQQRLRKHGLELEGGEGSIFAASVMAGGSLAPRVGGICERAEAAALLVQQHHARDSDRPAALHQAGLDHGYAGLWAPAVQGPRGEGAPRCWPRVWWPPMCTGKWRAGSSPFLHISHGVVGWSADSQHVAAVLMKYLAKLSAAGIDWAEGGGFNMGPEKWILLKQLRGVRGLWAAAEEAACRPRAGAWSTLDDFRFAAYVAPRLGRPRVDEHGETKPHLPVAMETCAQDLPMQVRVVRGPRPIGPAPPVGCSRGVGDWRRPLAKVCAAVSREHLPEAWGAVVATVEQKLLGRYDVVGYDRTKCVGRRARHLMEVGAYVAKAVRQLHGASLLCPLFKAQSDKLAGFLMEAAAFLGKIIASLARCRPCRTGCRFAGYANGEYEAALAAQRKEWVTWANESLSHGAGRAHRCSKFRGLQGVGTAWHSQQQDASPHLACDREMQPRA
ncbi:unnamed protein product, partial [Prorocentrum cordatum]